MPGPLKEALRRRRYASGVLVKDAVRAWFRSQPETTFAGGIRLWGTATQCVLKQMMVMLRK